MDFGLNPAGKRDGERKENTFFLPGPWMLLCIWPRFVPIAPCMTQMPSGPLLYTLCPLCVWMKALPDIKGRIQKDTAFAVSISEYRILVNFIVYELSLTGSCFLSFLIKSCLYKTSLRISLPVEILS